MKHLTIEIPDNLNLNERETKRFLAAKMYESGNFLLDRRQIWLDYQKLHFQRYLGTLTFH